jgi:formylglycine-generating enzyme required for sulfatase activity
MEIDKILREKGVSKEVEYALKMGVEHERLHLQTSVPLLMQLDAGFMKEWNWECFDTDFEPVDLSFVEVESGRVSFGSGEYYESVEDFRWDNEQGKVDMDIDGFQVSKYPITNTQVVEFIESGGYEVDRYWSENEDSLRWFRESGLEKGCPFNFRKKLRGGFEYRLLGGWIDKVPYSLPAMLNYHEATAICNYLGGRMITELEWMRVHENSSLGNVDMKSFIPMDVRKFNGFEVGNVACWTHGDFAPLSEKKFVVSDLYPEFSREWFNDKHAVLKGVSFAGSGHMLDIEFRDFMQKVMYYPASTYVVKNK